MENLAKKILILSFPTCGTYTLLVKKRKLPKLAGYPFRSFHLLFFFGKQSLISFIKTTDYNHRLFLSLFGLGVGVDRCAAASCRSMLIYNFIIFIILVQTCVRRRWSINKQGTRTR
jgi:hypothetical protein